MSVEILFQDISKQNYLHGSIICWKIGVNNQFHSCWKVFLTIFGSVTGLLPNIQSVVISKSQFYLSSPISE